MERLCVAVNADGRHRLLQIKALTPTDVDELETGDGNIPLLKLHGSVDWQRKGNTGSSQVSLRHEDDRFALTCPDDELVIATPGPSKMREAQGLVKLWTLAKGELERADAIVFVGFRFPETDAYAREQLLGAIRENGAPGRSNPKVQLSLHVVLGNSPDHATRLAALLHFTCLKHRQEGRGSDPSFTVTTHPLFAQDFFTVARRVDLHR